MREFTSHPAGDEEPEEPLAPRVPDFTFTLDKVEFGCEMRTDADAILAWSELAGDAAVGDEIDVRSAAGVAFTARFFRLMMPGEEYRKFRAHLRRERTDPDVLVAIMQQINAEMERAVNESTSRPTSRSSSSSDGAVETAERRLQIISLPEGDVEFADPPLHRAPRASARRPQDHKRKRTRTRRTALGRCAMQPRSPGVSWRTGRTCSACSPVCARVSARRGSWSTPRRPSSLRSCSAPRMSPWRVTRRRGALRWSG